MKKELTLFKEPAKRRGNGQFAPKKTTAEKQIARFKDKMQVINRVALLIKDNGKFTRLQIQTIIDYSK